MSIDFLDADVNKQMIRLGLRVLHYRKLKNFTQEDLAERAGISVAVISRIENSASNTEVVTILKIANALKVEPHKLFDFRERE